jgi:hypothetical protein
MKMERELSNNHRVNKNALWTVRTGYGGRGARGQDQSPCSTYTENREQCQPVPAGTRTQYVIDKRVKIS